MATNSINDMKLAHAVQFLDRVQHQLCLYARANVIRAASPPANQAQRVALANRVLTDPGNMASKLAVSMVSDASLTTTWNGTTDSTVQDETIFAVVNALWNSWLDIV